MTSALTVTDLAFGYPGREVGRDISMSLEAGEVLCLLGPNGGGKTTLLRTLLGLQPPLAGAVLVAGEDAVQMPPIRRARLLAYVPQAASASFAFTVFDMVLMGATVGIGLFSRPGARHREAAAQALEQLGICHLADRAFNEISGGERQLVLIARALVQQARVIVLDEPTASLDFANQARVLGMIGWLKRKGLAVLFSTHHPDQAFEVADGVAMLRHGRLLARGPVDDTLTAHALSELYGTAIHIAQIGTRKVCLIGPEGALL